MKSFRIAFAVTGLALVATPAIGQYYGTDGEQFVSAVEKRDGNKATELLAGHPTIVDTKDAKGDTGLIVAIRDSDNDWAAFLLNKGADPDAHGANGDTPLIAAAKAGFDEAVGWLIGLHADVNDTNKAGETPLIVAVQQRNTRMVKALLEAGADPDRTDNIAGYSARDYADRDPRARDIQKLINDKKPKAVAN